MTDVVFYVGAHPDDALLFRGDQLHADMHSPGVRTVHIITTAGDAGATDGWWQRRERGAVDAMAAAMSPAPVTDELVDVAGRRVRRYSTGEWAVWCLRLPDGGLDGRGFPATGHRSLPRLQSGAIPSLTAVDGSATYNGWASVTATLQGIVTKERQGAANPRPWVNASDYNRSANPGDHPDHYATADALRSFVSSGYNRAWWVSYDTSNRPANIEGFDRDAKRLLVAAYGRETGGVNEAEWGWWGEKRYERLETA